MDISLNAYEYLTKEAILQALGIRVTIGVGENPGMVVIDLYNVSEEVLNYVKSKVDNNAVRPLTDLVIIERHGTMFSSAILERDGIIAELLIVLEGSKQTNSDILNLQERARRIIGVT